MDSQHTNNHYKEPTPESFKNSSTFTKQRAALDVVIGLAGRTPKGQLEKDFFRLDGDFLQLGVSTLVP